MLLSCLVRQKKHLRQNETERWEIVTSLFTSLLCATPSFSFVICHVFRTCVFFVLHWLLDEDGIVLCFVFVQSGCASAKPLIRSICFGVCAPSERSLHISAALIGTGMAPHWCVNSTVGLIYSRVYFQFSGFVNLVYKFEDFIRGFPRPLYMLKAFGSE